MNFFLGINLGAERCESSSDTHAFYYTHAEWSANVMDTTWVSNDGCELLKQWLFSRQNVRS